MEQSHNHHGPYGQPGLEAVGSNQPDLEVATHEHLQYGHSLPEALHHHPVYAATGKERAAPAYSAVYAGAYSDGHHPEHYTPVAPYPPYEASEPAAAQQKPRRKRLWIIIGLLAAAVVILAAVLGGVLGSRAANSSGDEAAAQAGGRSGEETGAEDANKGAPGSTTTGDNPSPAATNSPAIRQGSGLTATGWQRPDGSVETFLFYQDTHNGLRYSRCDSADRSPGNESTGWGPPISFGGDFVKPGTRLGGTTFVYGDKHKPQIELFYTGFETRLLGLNINSQLKPNSTDDSVNSVDISTGLDSAITALWPWVVYQNASGGIVHTRNRLGGDRKPASVWDVNPLNFKAIRGSQLALVPMLTDFTRISIKGGYALFHQKSDLKLAVHITDLDSDELAENYPLSWPTALPSITLPELAPIAAFSVARADDDDGRVDTYVLYLDDKADINVLYTDSWTGREAEWKTARPEALQGADEDTDIACVGMATSNNGADTRPLLLGEVSTASRCYFQRGGEVVEVRLTADTRAGTRDWVVTGTVPIPKAVPAE